MGFLAKYQAVFSAVKSMLTYVPAVPYSPAVPAHDGIPEVPEVLAVPASGVASLGTVVLGEQFTLGALPKQSLTLRVHRSTRRLWALC